ncbi:MAG: hypothetical protein M5U34_44825 [Chloroflexi bacterium]|nr:hypothetical protein [Chloroflexota bacterium]
MRLSFGLNQVWGTVPRLYGGKPLTLKTAVLHPHLSSPARTQSVSKFRCSGRQTAVLPSPITANQRPFYTLSLINHPHQSISIFCYSGSQTAVSHPYLSAQPTPPNQSRNFATQEGKRPLCPSSLQPTAVLHPHPSSTSPTQSVSKSAIHGKPNGRSPIPSTTNQRPFLTPISHHPISPSRSQHFAIQEGKRPFSIPHPNQPTAVLTPISHHPTTRYFATQRPNGRSPIPSTTNQRPFSHHQHTKPTAVITPTSHHQTAPNRSRNFATQEGQTAVLPSSSQPTNGRSPPHLSPTAPLSQSHHFATQEAKRPLSHPQHNLPTAISPYT